MRFPAFAIRAAWSALLASACLGGPLTAACAQDLPGGLQLGMTAQQLQDAVTALRRVAHPAHLAGGLVGAWSGPPVEIAGVALTPTFFFADAQLRRVEYLASPSPAEAFDALVAWGRAAWGPELASDSPEGAYAAWTDGEEADVYVQRTGAAPRLQVRLVIKQRVVKDGSEL